MLLRICLLFFVLAAPPLSSSEEYFAERCLTCKCTWSGGKRTADCKDLNLKDIPKTLSPDLRDLDFSNNPLYELKANVFESANLKDVHKLRLQNCSLEFVHETAFNDLVILIELDLGRNNIQVLHKDVFRENGKLRVLNLSYNKIRALPDNLFYNMTYLQRVELNNNQIQHIGPKVFVLLPVLAHVDVSNNDLKTMTQDFTEGLTRLNSLKVEGNPWVCDCHLQKFRKRTIESLLVTNPTVCDEPPRLKGAKWNDLSVIFACTPKIIEPNPNTIIEVDSSNFTITCKVMGEPTPEIEWVYNGRILERDPRTSSSKYVVQKSSKSIISWKNLTIVNVSYRDRGEYTCRAKNPGGVDEKNLTLEVNCGDCNNLILGSSPISNAFPLIIGLSIAVVLLVVMIVVILMCCCKKRPGNYSGKRHDLSESNEFIGLDGRPEMEKALITDVNPVVKPPRTCTITTSVMTPGTEVSELNRTLLDGDSVFGMGEEESRSYDFDNRGPPQKLLETDSVYPPDLLSFPAKHLQISPAGSQASTVADTSRLPPHHGLHSPLESALYDSPSLYRTLPYSRSQSPFVGTPARFARGQGGYVTIPRRPRQSWSSEPPASEIGDPVYDNLGIRSTAAGSSQLSLNRLGEATTPKCARPVAFALSPTQCVPIAENESVPVATTLPRVAPHRALSPVRVRAPAPVRSPEGAVPANRRDSTSSLPPSTGKVHKIPPQPPPKPKKRTSTGPLFEDEGEDGTEV